MYVSSHARCRVHMPPLVLDKGPGHCNPQKEEQHMCIPGGPHSLCWVHMIPITLAGSRPSTMQSHKAEQHLQTASETPPTAGPNQVLHIALAGCQPTWRAASEAVGSTPSSRLPVLSLALASIKAMAFLA